MQQPRMSIVSLYERSQLQNEPICSCVCVCKQKPSGGSTLNFGQCLSLEVRKKRGIFTLYFVYFHSVQFDYKQNMFIEYLCNFLNI